MLKNRGGGRCDKNSALNQRFTLRSELLPEIFRTVISGGTSIRDLRQSPKRGRFDLWTNGFDIFHKNGEFSF